MTNEASTGVVLSILIVNFNGKHFLAPCVDSIRKFVRIPFELIVVDNASSDGSVELLATNYAEITLIRSDINLGFSAGNNLAARSAKGEFLLLLNNDTLLLEDIASAVAKLSSNPKIGALGCKTLGKTNEYRYSTGHFPSPQRLISIATTLRRHGPFAKGKFVDTGENIYDVDWLEGSFILTRRALWNQLEGMDEGYFMYVEDIDFCKRVNIAGFRVVYFPQLSFVHYGGYSSARLGMLIKGYRRYHRKFSSGMVQLIANLILTLGLMLKAGIYALSSLVRGRGLGEKSLSCWAALKDSPW